MTSVQFKSLTALHDFIQRTPRADGCNAVSEVEGRGESWDGGFSYDDAMTCAATGGRWDDGAQRMVQMTAQTDRAMQGCAQDYDYLTHGEYLDVTEYLTGSPDHWIATDDEGAKPIVRIGVASARSAMVSAEAAFNRGAAVLSVINALEMSGVSTELWSVYGQRYNGKQYQCETLVKPSASPWSPGSAAFALCHPAFDRRLMFRVFEACQEFAECTHNGYGQPSDHPKADFGVWVPVMRGDSGYSDPEMAVTTMRQIMADAGVALD